MKVPEMITCAWLDAVVDAELIFAESNLRLAFFEMERKEKALQGPRYDMMRGSAEFMDAWDRWSRVNNEVSRRGIQVRRKNRR